ncbi:hypothetical protein F5883DRAFT_707913 [Diaporthe sp. PMI_573]|nr:hypothetical protein F5883DRAFT_707913 [Diaporthaceae sp. PMI_573]
MKLITTFLSLLALFIGFLSSMAATAPLSTITSCTTTTITPSPSPGFTSTTVGATSTTLTLTTTTIIMPSSTATSFTTVTAPVPTGTAVPEYGQCGGLGYTGPTACENPFVCVCASAWWCQCQAATFREFELEDNIPSTARADETPPALHPNSITLTCWPKHFPVVVSPAPQPPEAS